MTMATKIYFIIDYYFLKLQRFYKYIYFGHIMSKACQDVIKQWQGLKYVDVKDAQVSLHKILTWTKTKSRKEGKNGKRKCCYKPVTLSSEINGKKPCCFQFCNGMQTQSMLILKMKNVWEL